MVYGLTGGIASGKSTVAALLRRRGLTVIDADQIAREVVTPPSSTLDRIVECFGSSVLTSTGELDRATLATAVFADGAARERLNAIVHPAIALESGRQIAAALATAQGPVFYEAALLVETDAWRDFAGLIVVACDAETQIARTMERDGVARADAEARLAAQLPLEEKVRVADHVIWNDGPLEELEAAVDALLSELSPPNSLSGT